MDKTLEAKLQKEYPFMKRENSRKEENSYQAWGCQCGGGWYQIIDRLCADIVRRYASVDRPVDLIVL